MITSIKKRPSIKLRIAIYARFSDDKQTETSADDQIALVKKTLGDEHEYTVFKDEGISGRFDGNRPQYNKMFKALRNDKGEKAFDILACEIISRLNRDEANSHILYRELKFLRIELWEQMSGRDVDPITHTIGAMTAAKFSEDLANFVKRGQNAAIARGKFNGLPPYGYQVCRTVLDDNTAPTGRREIIEAEAVIVRSIYKEYIKGLSPLSIAKGLNEDGIKPPRKIKVWQGSTISGGRHYQTGIIGRRMYIGEYYRGITTQRKDHLEGVTKVYKNPESELLGFDCPELAILDKKLFNKAVALRWKNAIGPRKAVRRPKSLISGLVTCKKCGGNFICIAGHKTAQSFGCRVAWREGGCDNKQSISGKNLTKRILEGLVEITNNTKDMEKIHKLARDFEQQKRRESKVNTKEFTTKIKKAEKENANIMDAIISGIKLDGLQDKVNKNNADIEAWKALMNLQHEPEGKIISLPIAATIMNNNIMGLIKTFNKSDKLDRADQAVVVSKLQGLIGKVEVLALGGRKHEITITPRTDKLIQATLSSKALYEEFKKDIGDVSELAKVKTV